MTTENEKDKKSTGGAAIETLFKAGVTVRAYSDASGNVDLRDLFCGLGDKIAEVQKGDLADVEAHLVSQYVTLDSLFHSLALRASKTQYMEQIKTFISLALKAQNQSRMTMETLVRMKNPQPYVQQNVAVNQQINNSFSPAQPLKTAAPVIVEQGENEKPTTELLENKTNEYERLDTGTQSAAINADKDVEAVAILDGGKDA